MVSLIFYGCYYIDVGLVCCGFGFRCVFVLDVVLGWVGDLLVSCLLGVGWFVVLYVLLDV